MSSPHGSLSHSLPSLQSLLAHSLCVCVCGSSVSLTRVCVCVCVWLSLHTALLSSGTFSPLLFSSPLHSSPPLPFCPFRPSPHSYPRGLPLFLPAVYQSHILFAHTQ